MADARQPGGGDQIVLLSRLIDKTATVLVAAIYGLTLFGISYEISVAVGYLAGQNTAILISYLTDTGSGITVTIGIGTGVLGTAYGWYQRVLHRRTIAHFAPQLAHYQRLLDPQRTSSDLNPDGTTNPSDL